MRKHLVPKKRFEASKNAQGDSPLEVAMADELGCIDIYTLQRSARLLQWKYAEPI